MPLQKPPPQGLAAPDPRTSKRRHIQERRRTLQTISELSIDETAPLKLRVTFGTNQMAPSDRSGTSSGTKTSNMNKRRSLPQYSTRANYVDPRSAPPVPPIRQTALQHSMKVQTSPSSSDKYEAGWNARRERARIQAEQALSGSRQTGTNYKHMHGKSSTSSIRPSAQQFAQEYPSLKPTSSQQQLLQNSRSITGTPRSDGRYSFGNSSKYEHRDYEGESSERASTDSSSQQSAYEIAVRRSRSGSSTGSARSIHHPPMPASMLQVPPRMYTNPYYGIGYAIPQPACFTAQHIHPDRSVSLPIMTLDYPVAQYVDHMPRSHSSNAHDAPAKHRAGHVRSRHQQPYDGRGAVRATQHQQHPQPARPSSDRRRTRSQSSLKSAVPAHINSPPPAYSASVATDQHADKLAVPPTAAAAAGADHRAVPNRENLTKWKTEREEARAEFDGIQRAKMKERVRRANELELEKERELRLLGKGMANEKACRVLGRDVHDVEGEMGGEKREVVGAVGGSEKKGAKAEKQRGCFGGLFGGFGRG